eukprot:1026-Heterococcus_DN1.PRE.3
MTMIHSNHSIYVLISVKCGAHEHKVYKAYAAFMVIIYPLGIPALYAYLLWSNRQKLSSKYNASVRMLNRNRDVSLRPTRFLWKPYSSRMYYWEVIECMRRLLLTGAVVFIKPGTPAQAAVACILAVVSMAIALYCQPHADSLDGKIYTVGAMIIFLRAALAQMVMVGRRAYMSRQNSMLGIGKIDHTTNDVSGGLEESTEDTNDSTVKPSAVSMLSRHGGGDKQPVNRAVDEEQQQCDADPHEVKF